VLYDHLPHNDGTSAPNEYIFNLTIPDINCPNCALQVVNPMTDKIGAGTCCTYPPAGCFSVYHSCSDISISGSQDPATWAASFSSPAGGRRGAYTQEATSAWVSVAGGTNRFGLSAAYTGPVADTCPSVTTGVPTTTGVLTTTGVAATTGVATGSSKSQSSSASSVTAVGGLLGFATFASSLF
jgi:hypothetical protein